MTLQHKELYVIYRVKAKGGISAALPSCWELGVQKFLWPKTLMVHMSNQGNEQGESFGVCLGHHVCAVK